MKKILGTQTMRREVLSFTIVIGILITGLTTASAVGTVPLLTDMTVTDAVENELLLDIAVPSHRIDVSTIEGVVTLSGSVDNILVKDRAARIARVVKGVRAVVNEIEVNPPILRTDDQIREDAESALLYDPATDAFEVRVRVEDNVVTLSGTVDSWEEKDLCAKVVKGVKGVKGIDNRIVVAWPEKRSDYEIKTEVEQALKWDAYIDQGLIDVEVSNAEVKLSGIVGSAAEKSWASIDAYVHGVKSVDNTGLVVKRWARDEDLKKKKYVKKSPEEVKDAVKDALFYDPRVSSFKIIPYVTKDGRRVTLRGTVDNLKAKRAAAQDARNTAGVREVENRIKVRPAVLLSDENIEKRVREALVRDPYLESYEITVDVRNGVADLYGNVDTAFEKSQADDVVSKVAGVFTVDNNLVVEKDYDAYIYDPYVDDWYLRDYDWYYHRPRLPTKSDWQIEKDIKDELFWSPFVDSDDVNVTVEDGVATLTGSVDSWSEYNAAVNNAYEGGAVYVDNDLTLEWAS